MTNPRCQLKVEANVCDTLSCDEIPAVIAEQSYRVTSCAACNKIYHNAKAALDNC